MLNDRMHQLSAQIAKMTPKQRQQFAMQHKNDPILVSMTKFVNDQENALRSSLQAQQNPPNPARPPVVDEEIAGMAGLPAPTVDPPASGIAAGMGDNSPPPQPMSMAKGGRVKGYAGAEGSWVQGEQPFTLFGGAPAERPVQDPDALEKALRAANQASLQFSGFPLSAQDKAKIVESFKADPARAQRQMVPRAELATQQDLNMRPYVPRRDPSTAAMEQSMLEQRQRASKAQQPAPPAQMHAAPPAAPGGGGVAGLPGIAVPGAPGRPTMQVPDAGFDPIARYQEMLQGRAEDPFAKESQRVSDMEVAAATDARDRTKADIEAEGIAGLDREKRLNKREGRLDEQERKLPGIAMLEAGLAMMASKSPHALQGIGEGALRGTKVYREGIKDLEAGREKIEDAFFQLEELRRGERKANSKELRDKEAGIRTAMTAGAARVVDGLVRAHGYQREDAKEGLKAVMEDLKSRRQLAGDQFRGQAAMYGADQSLRGSLAHSNAVVKAAGMRANAGGDDDSLKRTRVVIAAQKLVDDAVNSEREAAMKSFATWGPMQEQAARQRAFANLPPDVRQLLGQPGSVAPTGPRLDPTQFQVRVKP